jgi:hypothetical protein
MTGMSAKTWARTWAAQWAEAPVIHGEVCRGCVADSAARRVGKNTLKAQTADAEIRETAAGAYCVSCFLALPACPACGQAPTSHAEYPCVACENAEDVAMCVASGGRQASPTYRGWSLAYSGDGQDNGPYRRGRTVRRIFEH